MDVQAKLADLIHDFKNAMLVTKSGGHDLDARPMAIAEVEPDGTIWFITDRDSGKVDELSRDKNVVVTMQTSNKFVVVQGEADVVDDQGKVDQVWNETFKIWFPEGQESSSVTLVRVTPHYGEYWDNSGAEGIRYALKVGAAYVKGERPELDSGINASAKM